MLAYATTKISVLRGTTEDAYGDVYDTAAPAHQHIPASLIERTRRVFDPVSLTPHIIKYSVCRVNNGTDIQQNDRIYDESDEAIYAIDSIITPKRPMAAADMRIDLTRVN